MYPGKDAGSRAENRFVTLFLQIPEPRWSVDCRILVADGCDVPLDPLTAEVSTVRPAMSLIAGNPLVAVARAGSMP